MLDYYLDGKKIQHSEMQRDVGDLMQGTLKVNLKVESVMKETNAMLN